MMLHYHGTPITPASVLHTLAGRSFCISYAEPRDLPFALRCGQSVMGDNGAFSVHTRGLAPDWPGYYRWVEPWLGHPHWAVVPDAIGGSEADNLALAEQWPFRREHAAMVWHLHEGLDHLRRLADEWPRIAFGSSGQYWQPGTDAWTSRVDAAWDILAQRRCTPWVHMLRAMTQASEGRWPFASADSTNIARNHASGGKVAARMADLIDARNPPPRYAAPATQERLFA